MLIKLTTNLSDAQRLYEAGDVCEMEEVQARRWIAAGWAVAVTPIEAAALAAPPENATLPPARRRPAAP